MGERDSRPKKLYLVNVETELVVAARDEVEAQYEAESCVRIEDDGAEISTLAREITNEEDLPHPWEMGAIPFNSERDRTCGDYLAALPNSVAQEGDPK